MMVRYFILIWFFLLPTLLSAQISAYDGRSKSPTIKITKNTVYKKNKVVGIIRSNLIYERLESEFMPSLVVKGDEIYFINDGEEEIDVVEEFGYILSDNKIYTSRDTTDFIYLTIKDKFVYRGSIDNKKIVRIEGNYTLIELIATLYFLEKI